MTELKIGNQMNRIYHQFDGLMKSSRFDECNRILSEIKTAETSTDLLLCYLTATLPARHEIPYRTTFFRYAEAEIIRRHEWEPGILKGLE